jgi:hypothetical protein
MSRRDTESQQLTAYSLQQASVGQCVHRCSSPDERSVASANDGRCTVPVEPTWQVETTMTADSLRLTACGQDEDEMLIAEDLPEAEPLNVRADE